MSATSTRISSLGVNPSTTFDYSSTIDGQQEGNDKNADEAALAKLMLVSPTFTDPVIAVDLGDVLSQTNHTVAQWHNEQFGTEMDISLFYYYYYWKNPLWGTPNETMKKVGDFYSSNRIHHAVPVPGAREGIQSLRAMGFRLVIVTARTPDIREMSCAWVDNHFPGMFHTVICTGQFKDVHKGRHEDVIRLSKAEVCANLNARLLVDDSAENALHCATAASPTRVLLFGDYEWNKRLSGPGDAMIEMSFNRRLEAEGGREFWKEETVPIPADAPLWRVKNWSEVVLWVQKAKSEGTI